LIRGEGEFTLYELLQALQASTPDYNIIPGLSFRWKGEIFNNKDRGAIKDLNLLPIPARDRLLDLESYSPDQLSMVMGSRGCPFNCGFCGSQSMWGRNVRYRSIDSILGEIDELRTKYSVKNVILMDDSFTINRQRVKEFCYAMIDNHVNITWSCLSRVESISDELIISMKKAGCRRITIGIESGSQRVLNMINKGITLKLVRNAVSILRRNKMSWAGFFMFGFPTETEEEIFDTLKFMKELKPDWAYVSIFTPYPDTELFNLCREKGLIQGQVDYGRYTHQIPHLPFTEKIPKERSDEIARHLLKEFHKYNRSFRSLAKRALTRNYHKNPEHILHDIKRIMTWIK